MEVLPDEVVGDILLRLPPADPASLVRAALVSKLWCRIVCGASFRRRFREFHRAAPLLGVLCNTSNSSARFVPTSSFRPPQPLADHLTARQDQEDESCCVALDARHGLVLLYLVVGDDDALVVWDPTTDDRWEVAPAPAPDICDSRLDWHATVLRNDKDTPFIVVRVVTQSSRQPRWCLRVYSSEDASWGEQTLLPDPECRVDNAPTALVGNKLYFMMNSGTRLLSFDLATRETSMIHLPPKASECATALMAVEEDAGLGFARLDKSATLSLWSMDGDMGWTQTRVIELEKLRPLSADSIYCPFIGLAHAVGVFSVATFDDGLLRFDLKSGRVSTVSEVECDTFGFLGRFPCVVPYTGFCTPACLRY